LSIHRNSSFDTNRNLQESKEAETWADKDTKGGKAKKEAAEEKRKADLARKAENAKLLAEEEASLQAAKANSAGSKKKVASKSSGSGAVAAEGDLGSLSGEENPEAKEKAPQEVESFAATGIDNALDLLEVVTAKMDKASVGQQAAKIEQHPEVRMKLSLALRY
jgi:hypothetical protein